MFEIAEFAPEFALKQNTNSMFYVRLSCSCYKIFYKGTASENDNGTRRLNKNMQIE